jgi:UDP-N-acetylmuramate--alanine ligase
VLMDLPGKRVHLVGIGGSGLSAVARVLMEFGFDVSGSDLRASSVAEALARDGAAISIGHDPANVNGADLVVISSAVPSSNVEVRAARALGIPVWKRPEMLHRMMDRYRAIAVAGTHGKTTTTAMIATILVRAQLDPTVIVGGEVHDLGTNARAGGGRLFVVEADEYDRTFLRLTPYVAVVTSIEHDHPDCYPTFEDYRTAFAEFASLIQDDGLLVASWDDPVARAIAEEQRDAGTEVILYGTNDGADVMSTSMRPNSAGGMDFLAAGERATLGWVRLQVPGRHNVLNALAALATVRHLGVPFGLARGALKSFRGVGRRFEIKGVADGVVVVDDYAHHPTQIQATLETARRRFPRRPIWAVWQPHTYSRTKALLPAFAESFAAADHVLVLPIYAARESDSLGISSGDVVDRVSHRDLRLVGSLEEALVVLGTEVSGGDVVLTLGAGDGNLVGEWLLEALETR